MRENCQSGSMSGNRKQDQAKPDCGDEAKAQSTNHRETTVTAPVLDSTHQNAPWLEGGAPSSAAIHMLDLKTRKVTTLSGSEGFYSPIGHPPAATSWRSR